MRTAARGAARRPGCRPAFSLRTFLPTSIPYVTLIYFLLFYLAQKLKTGQALLGENAHLIDTGPRGGGEANLYPGVLGAQAVGTHPRLARAWAGAARVPRRRSKAWPRAGREGLTPGEARAPSREVPASPSAAGPALGPCRLRDAGRRASGRSVGLRVCTTGGAQVFWGPPRAQGAGTAQKEGVRATLPPPHPRHPPVSIAC